VKALAASPLGFVVGIAIGALGGGGSVITVPLLVFVVGLQPAAATTASLVIVGVASSLGAYTHWRAGRVDVRQGTIFGVVGIAGSVAGSTLNRALDGDVLLSGFALLMLLAAWRILTGCPSCTATGEAEALAGAREPSRTGPPPTRLRRMATVAAAGTGVGFLTGLFGVGGGFVIVPALTLALGFNMPRAVGTSLLVVVINIVVALGARVGAPVDWGVVLPFVVTATAGVLAGKRIADRIAPAVTQRWFAGLLVAMALYTGARGLAGL